jgi:hypothetical protein
MMAVVNPHTQVLDVRAQVVSLLVLRMVSMKRSSIIILRE